MKGIRYCGNCADYDKNRHRCKAGATIETDARDPFYDDCPLPNVRDEIHGEWINRKDWHSDVKQFYNCWLCSNCEHVKTRGWEHTKEGKKPASSFCEYCGAYMRGT